jgi:uncharacterized protein
MSLFDDNLEWVQSGESTISGIYRGKGEFGEYLGRLAEKALAVRALSFMADGDTVVAFTEVTAGSEMGEDADVYMLRDGKIVRAQIYTDTAMIVLTVWAAVAATTGASYFWPIWPILGAAIGLISHALAVRPAMKTVSN